MYVQLPPRIKVCLYSPLIIDTTGAAIEMFYFGPVHTKRSCFAPDTAIVHTTTPKTITENGVIRKRSPEWSDLKAMLFGNAVS